MSKIREENPFPGITSRLGRDLSFNKEIRNKDGKIVRIRALERAAFDYGQRKFLRPKAKKDNQPRIAVVGSGPFGLTVSVNLALRDCNVRVFEALHELGGSLRCAIPAFRLPRSVLETEIGYARSLGVDFETNCLVGRTLSLEDLFARGFMAVCLAPGPGEPELSGLNGEELGGVFFVDDFLSRVNLMEACRFPAYKTAVSAGKRVVIIGGGDRALDCARILLRMKRHATVVFPETEEDLHVRGDVFRQTVEEGVPVEFLTRAVEICGHESGHVRGVKCVRLDYADTDTSGRWKLLPVKGSDFVIEADTVLTVSSYRSSPMFAKLFPGIRLNKNGTVWINKNTSMTSIPGVFAACGTRGGASEITNVLQEAKELSARIHRYVAEQTA